MRNTPKENKPKLNEAGMASIVVTMIIMFVVILIVLAAARLARREQRQSLDRQLNTQAFYAAESGVNDAVAAIEADLALPSPTFSDDEFNSLCSGTGSFMDVAGLGNGSLDTAQSVKYTCLFVDPTPTTWEGTVDDTSRTTPVKDANGGTISTITLAWQDKDGSSNFACGTSFTFTPNNTWPCTTPMLRFDLVPTTVVNRTALNANVMTGFLFPTTGGVTTMNYAPGAQRIAINCSTATVPKFCRVTITVPALIGYYVRIKSIYGGAGVTVCANSNDCRSGVELAGSQIVIDSTGKAQDILRRIQVRVPLVGAEGVPEFAIQSGDNICKKLEIIGGTATSSDGLCAID